MANNIETVTLFQAACDRQLIEGATSGWMEANAGQVKYSGGRDVKIPALSTDGLGDYDRTSGYPRGKVSVTYQTKTMTQDRGIQFLLDRIDVDESGFIANASAAMSTFQSENVIPEVDAYRYSTLQVHLRGGQQQGIFPRSFHDLKPGQERYHRDTGHLRLG